MGSILRESMSWLLYNSNVEKTLIYCHSSTSELITLEGLCCTKKNQILFRKKRMIFRPRTRVQRDDTCRHPHMQQQVFKKHFVFIHSDTAASNSNFLFDFCENQRHNFMTHGFQTTKAFSLRCLFLNVFGFLVLEASLKQIVERYV